jgi:hypothetical protein
VLQQQNACTKSHILIHQCKTKQVIYTSLFSRASDIFKTLIINLSSCRRLVVALHIQRVAETTSPQTPCRVYIRSFRLLLPPTRQLCFTDPKIIPRSSHDIAVFISAFHQPCLTVGVSVDIGRQGRNGNLFYEYSKHEIFQCMFLIYKNV